MVPFRLSTANWITVVNSNGRRGLLITPRALGTPSPSISGFAVMKTTVTPAVASSRPISGPVGPSSKLQSTKATSMLPNGGTSSRLAAMPTTLNPSSITASSAIMARIGSSSTMSTFVTLHSTPFCAEAKRSMYCSEAYSDFILRSGALVPSPVERRSVIARALGGSGHDNGFRL